MEGNLRLRDQDMIAFQNQMDELARATGDLFQSTDATFVAGTNQGLFTDAGAEIVAAPPPGLASRLQVNALVDPTLGGDLWRVRSGVNAAAPGPPGDTTQIRAYLDGLRSNLTFTPGLGLPNNSRLGDWATSMIAVQQNERVAAEKTKDNSTVALSSLNLARTGADGVNTDTELQSMIALEQSYNANAKVLQTVSGLLDSLLQI